MHLQSIRITKALSCSLLFWGAVTGYTETLVLSPTADTALRSTAPNNNFGGAANLPAGVSNQGAPINRALFRFDLADIPPNATIISATFELHVVQTGRGPANFSLHRILVDWGEGDKTVAVTGAPATAGEATWNARFHPDTAWATGGGAAGTDYSTDASANGILGSASSIGSFASQGMVDDLRFWQANPDENFGWILRAAVESPGSGKLVASKESTAPEIRPVLTIEYTPAAPELPEPPVIVDVRVVDGQFQFSFEAQAGFPYTVEARSMVGDGEWMVVMTSPAQAADMVLDVSDPISPGSRFYRVRSP